jgi:transposase-like protein
VVGVGSGAPPMTSPAPKHPTPAITCAFCGSGAVERIGQWGGQLITSQWRCHGCGSYFEALRDDYAAARVTDSSEPK